MTLFYKLSILMGIIVLASNYLVQFPVNYFGLNEILTYGAFSYPISFLITDLVFILPQLLITIALPGFISLI